MEDHALDVAAAGGDGYVQGGDDQFGVVEFAHRVAEQAAAEQVDHGCR
ncbi:hypothetical protein M2271_003914 [Streptomyces sp. LBL]|nr:hypothetical protein [Streptomyces sp. LBL]MDH6626097.1 hypothetical protein [Streptomyces sp. LBL]